MKIEGSKDRRCGFCLRVFGPGGYTVHVRAEIRRLVRSLTTH